MEAIDEAFDVILCWVCYGGMLDCSTVHPGLFGRQRRAGEVVNEVGRVDGQSEVQGSTATWNEGYSARCNAGMDDEQLVQCVDWRQ